MTRDSIYERINRVFKDIFDDENISVSDTTKADDIEDWDSLMHINLVLAIEAEFEVRFTMNEVTGFKNVGEVVDVLEVRAKT